MKKRYIVLYYVVLFGSALFFVITLIWLLALNNSLPIITFIWGAVLAYVALYVKHIIDKKPEIITKKKK